jgi:hypothetical protein
MHNVIQNDIKHFWMQFCRPNCRSFPKEYEVSQQKVTYLTTEELAALIKYDSRTIRDRLKDSVLIEGRHYIRPFGGRKTLYIWEQIEADMAKASNSATYGIPLSNGGVLNG